MSPDASGLLATANELRPENYSLVLPRVVRLLVVDDAEVPDLFIGRLDCWLDVPCVVRAVRRLSDRLVAVLST